MDELQQQKSQEISSLSFDFFCYISYFVSCIATIFQKKPLSHPKILGVPWWSSEYNFFMFFPLSVTGCVPLPPPFVIQSDTFLCSCLLNLHSMGKGKKKCSLSLCLIFFILFMKILSPSFVPLSHQDEQAFIFWAPTGGKSSFWNDYCLIANLYLALGLSVSLPRWIICKRIGGKLLWGLWNIYPRGSQQFIQLL